MNIFHYSTLHKKAAYQPSDEQCRVAATTEQDLEANSPINLREIHLRSWHLRRDTCKNNKISGHFLRKGEVSKLYNWDETCKEVCDEILKTSTRKGANFFFLRQYRAEGAESVDTFSSRSISMKC